MLRSNLVLKPGGLLLFCSCMLFVPILMRLSQRLVESLRNQALSTKGILPMPCICTHGIRHFYNALSIGNILTEGDRINAHSFTHYELQPAFSKTSPIRTMASVIQSLSASQHTKYGHSMIVMSVLPWLKGWPSPSDLEHLLAIQQVKRAEVCKQNSTCPENTGNNRNRYQILLSISFSISDRQLTWKMFHP